MRDQCSSCPARLRHDEEGLQVRDRHLVDAGRALVPNHAGIGSHHILATDDKLHQECVRLWCGVIRSRLSRTDAEDQRHRWRSDARLHVETRQRVFETYAVSRLGRAARTGGSLSRTRRSKIDGAACTHAVQEGGETRWPTRPHTSSGCCWSVAGFTTTVIGRP